MLKNILTKDDRIISFSLIDCGFLDEVAVEVLAQSFQANTSLQEVQLINVFADIFLVSEANPKKVRGVVNILLSLKCHKACKKINLSANKFDRQEIVVAIVELIQSNSFIDELDISDNSFNIDMATILIKHLEVNKTIHHLYLNSSFFFEFSNNQAYLSRGIGVLIAEMLITNCTLKTLDLSDNMFNENDVRLIFGSLQFNHTLKAINLSNLAQGRCSLVDVSFNQALEKIDLSKNQWITGVNAVKIAKALEANTGIREINLKGTFTNPLDEKMLTVTLNKNLFITNIFGFEKNRPNKFKEEIALILRRNRKLQATEQGLIIPPEANFLPALLHLCIFSIRSNKFLQLEFNRLRNDQNQDEEFEPELASALSLNSNLDFLIEAANKIVTYQKQNKQLLSYISDEEIICLMQDLNTVVWARFSGLKKICKTKSMSLELYENCRNIILNQFFICGFLKRLKTMAYLHNSAYACAALALFETGKTRKKYLEKAAEIDSILLEKFILEYSRKGMDLLNNGSAIKEMRDFVAAKKLFIPKTRRLTR